MGPLYDTHKCRSHPNGLSITSSNTPTGVATCRTTMYGLALQQVWILYLRAPGTQMVRKSQIIALSCLCTASKPEARSQASTSQTPTLSHCQPSNPSSSAERVRCPRPESPSMAPHSGPRVSRPLARRIRPGRISSLGIHGSRPAMTCTLCVMASIKPRDRRAVCRPHYPRL